jgi:UDP-N-acetylmuramoyl-tripeptide--D-alanyl-D-alanine ligase
MRLSEVIATLNGAAPSAGPEELEREVAGYSIDSRAILEGELFFAIRGERYDGHDFAADALGKKAIAAVVSRDFALSTAGEEMKQGGAMLIPVEDTLAALQRLASSLLARWPGREVAITGSMGKTTTKEMTARCLERKGRVMKSVGNFNNDYGLPLSILKMESQGAKAEDFDFAVLEMGMNHKGEIARLASIAPPDVGVVTVVAPVHLEFFSSVDEIAEAKGELVTGIKTGGAAILNADDPRVSRMRDLRDDIDVRMFGIEEAAEVTARGIRHEGLGGTSFVLVTPRGEIPARLPVAGRHNLYNGLAAAAVADYFETPLDDIAAALGESASPRMRGEVISFEGGFTIIDDSYNSNPRALIEMVRTIKSSKDFKRKVVVAGEMLELGETGPALHREAGNQIARLGVDLLIGVRGLAEHIVEGAIEAGLARERAIFCATPEEAARALESRARAGDLILVKGSRGVKTEIVVQQMKREKR